MKKNDKQYLPAFIRRLLREEEKPKVEPKKFRWDTIASIASSLTAVAALLYTMYTFNKQYELNEKQFVFQKEQLKRELDAAKENQDIVNAQFRQNFDMLYEQAKALKDINNENKTANRPYFMTYAGLHYDEYNRLIIDGALLNEGKRGADNIQIYILVNSKKYIVGQINEIGINRENYFRNTITMTDNIRGKKLSIKLVVSYRDVGNGTPLKQQYEYNGKITIGEIPLGTPQQI